MVMVVRQLRRCKGRPRFQLGSMVPSPFQLCRHGPDNSCKFLRISVGRRFGGSNSNSAMILIGTRGCHRRRIGAIFTSGSGIGGVVWIVPLLLTTTVHRTEWRTWWWWWWWYCVRLHCLLLSGFSISKNVWILDTPRDVGSRLFLCG